jgi:ankyrin repeat protein
MSQPPILDIQNNAGWGTEFPSILTALYFGGANLNAGDQSLNTPLHLAAFEGQVQTINELVKYGAKLSMANLWQQRTPLGMAVLVGSLCYTRQVQMHRCSFCF